MHNFPVKTHQSDVLKNAHKRRVRIDTSDLPDTARQEFKDETNINYILGRFGVQSLRPATYGDYDYNIDLQTALNAIEQAQEGYDRLPPDMKKQYPDWQSVILALADGTKISEIREFLKETPTPEPEKKNETRPDAKGDPGPGASAADQGK